MGYDSTFEGSFDLDKPLTNEHTIYLQAFNRSRHMRRNAELTEKMEDPVRIAAGLPVGVDGCFYVGGADEDCGQAHTEDVLSYNESPADQPGLWCGWTPGISETSVDADVNDALVWDGGEKFYNYTEWIEYLIEHFLKPWGYVVNGEVAWRGESDDDRGTIYVKDNKVEAVDDDIKKGKPSWDR